MDGLTFKSSHFIFGYGLAYRVFGDDTFVFVVYVPEQGLFLLSPVHSVWFKKLYKPKQFFLKTRNLNNDKSLDIQELIIDHDLDVKEGDMKYDYIEKTSLLKIAL